LTQIFEYTNILKYLAKYDGRRLIIAADLSFQDYPKTQPEDRTMKYFKGVALLFLVLVLHFGIQCVENASAAEKADSTGWEKEGVYNRLYRVDQYQKLKGTLVEIIELTPMPGMAPGMGMIMISRDKEKVTVHLGPKLIVISMNYQKTVESLKSFWYKV
jgi:hypothetical protein